MLKVLKLLIEEIDVWFAEIFFLNFPGRIGIKIRSFYWSRRFHACGKVDIHSRCIITAPENITLGDHVVFMQNACLYTHNNASLTIGDRFSCNNNVYIAAGDFGEVIIGNDVSIGPNVVIRASNHNYKQSNLPINKQGHSGGRIVIEDDVWIGANVVIVPGAKIGKGSIIAAGAVVNTEIPPYSLAGGVPVKILKENCRDIG